ncbi:MAG: hypothetical protein CVV32_09520 [Methanomicrobiales archaeon HGW-Methanomicrobiales-3]|nr:MAG: hypothetical protein CVV32_09520 [Methanomicrobiales archaeon HGW-Methanomicrobiales-3]
MYDVIITSSLLAAIVITYFSLTSGIYDVFPYFYLIPIILIAFARPRLSIYGTVVVGWIYLALVFYIGLPDARLYAVATVWFYIFVSLGVLISTYSQVYRKEGEKSCGAYYNSQAGVFSYDRETLKIRDANRKFATMISFDCDELMRSPPCRISFPTARSGRGSLQRSVTCGGLAISKYGSGDSMGARAGHWSRQQKPASRALSVPLSISRTTNYRRRP